MEEDRMARIREENARAAAARRANIAKSVGENVLGLSVNEVVDDEEAIDTDIVQETPEDKRPHGLSIM